MQQANAKRSKPVAAAAHTTSQMGKPRLVLDVEGDIRTAHNIASFMAVASKALLSGEGVEDRLAMLTPDVAWGSFYIMSHVADLLKSAIGENVVGVQS